MLLLPAWLTWEGVEGLLTAGGTAALAVYAAVQVREAARDRLLRKALARRERRDRQAAALATLRGEFIRLSRLKARWQAADFAVLLASDAINEVDLVAPDWRGVTVGIGVLGGRTSVLAAIAYGLLADIALQIRIAKADIRLRAQFESDPNKLSGTDQTLVSQSLERWPARSEQLVAEIRQWLSDAADLLQEAIWHAPGGREGIPLDEGAITTEGGKRLLTQLLRETAPETRGGSPAPRQH